jgi:hypothetical protein
MLAAWASDEEESHSGAFGLSEAYGTVGDASGAEETKEAVDAVGAAFATPMVAENARKVERSAKNLGAIADNVDGKVLALKRERF